MPLSFEGTHNEDYYQVFKYMSPYIFAYVGIGLVLGLSVLGAAWGMFLTGSALNGAAIRAPRISSKNLVSIIFCEATAIYGVIMAIIMKAQIGAHPQQATTELEWANMQYGGYALFTAGLGVGLTNLFSGISVGVAGSSCALGRCIFFFYVVDVAVIVFLGVVESSFVFLLFFSVFLGWMVDLFTFGWC